MERDPIAQILTTEALARIFPPHRADRFFEALYGDVAEGAYDIRLVYQGYSGDELLLGLELHQRPGKCLACHLTYGLPAVFGRHPRIDIPGVVEAVLGLLEKSPSEIAWRLGATQERRPGLHLVPLFIRFEKTGPT